MSYASLMARHHLMVAVLFFALVGQVPMPGDGLLLPDLQVLPSENLYIEAGKAAGARTLRFDTTVINMGYGRLTLIGEYDKAINKTRATQFIETGHGGKPMERVAGEFIFHQGHHHWHFEDFILFELWTYKPDGALDQVVASTNKISFCMRDNLPLFGDKQSPRKYAACDPVVQGISVGWGDTYYSELPGQELDVTALPPGRYAIRATVDRHNRIMELNDDNNFVVQYVELDGMDIATLPDQSVVRKGSRKGSG